jgi:hypothetical protein
LAPSWGNIGLVISDFGFLNPIFEIRHPRFSAGLSRLHRACPSVFLDKHFIKEQRKYKAKQGIIKIVVVQLVGGKIKTVERSARSGQAGFSTVF